MKPQTLMWSLVVVLAVAAGTTSCSGGDGSSAASGSALAITEKVSVVDATESGGSLSVGGIQPLSMGLKSLAIDTSLIDSSAAYFTDTADVFVEERSVDALNIVNEILCMIGQTGYQDMVNQGNYKAMIDVSQCESRDAASSSNSKNQSSGSNMPEYEFWTVNSTRQDNNSDHIVKVWVHESADEWEPEKIIHVRSIITEGVSDTNPYGLFTMYFKGVTANAGTQLFKGLLKTVESGGEIQVQFVDQGGFGTTLFQEAVTVARSDTSGNTGSGTIYTYEYNAFEGTTEVTFDIAYSQDYFLREAQAGSTFCLDRNDFNETVWRYGLYDSNGARVERTSGFPIKYTNGGSTYHGWIGYWGLWFPDDVTISDGDTVTKQTYSANGGSEDTYNVFISGGKLVKHTKKNLTLADVKNVPLDYNEWDGSNWTDYRSVWNGTSFVKNASRSETTNWMYQDLSPTVDIDLTNVPYSNLNFWSQSLGGRVEVLLDACNFNDNGTTQDWSDDSFSCTATDTTSVVSFVEDMVYPTDTVPDTFACFVSCPDPANLDSTNPYFDSSNIENQAVSPFAASYYSYAYSAGGMVLTYNGSSVATTASNNNYEWGINSGPIFSPTGTNLAKLACDYDPSTTCAWQAWNSLDEYYTWETGPNDWNMFTALQDPADDSFLTFQAPLSVKYVHAAAGSYQGTSFFLEYNGFGDLWGLPGKCVDEDTGVATECGSGTRWVPELIITDGSELLDLSDDTTTYLVKALEKEQQMKSVNASNCSALSTSTYTLPDLTDWVDPNIGTEPTIDGAPAVIGGVLQGQ